MEWSIIVFWDSCRKSLNGPDFLHVKSLRYLRLKLLLILKKKIQHSTLKFEKILNLSNPENNSSDLGFLSEKLFSWSSGVLVNAVSENYFPERLIWRIILWKRILGYKMPIPQTPPLTTHKSEELYLTDNTIFRVHLFYFGYLLLNVSLVCDFILFEIQRLILNYQKITSKLLIN